MGVEWFEKSLFGDEDDIGPDSKQVLPADSRRRLPASLDRVFDPAEFQGMGQKILLAQYDHRLVPELVDHAYGASVIQRPQLLFLSPYGLNSPPYRRFRSQLLRQGLQFVDEFIECDRVRREERNSPLPEPCEIGWPDAIAPVNQQLWIETDDALAING